MVGFAATDSIGRVIVAFLIFTTSERRPRETWTFVGSFDFTARVHGIKSGRTLKEFRGHKSYVNSACYSRDASKVITGSSAPHLLMSKGLGEALKLFQVNTL